MMQSKTTNPNVFLGEVRLVSLLALAVLAVGACSSSSDDGSTSQEESSSSGADSGADSDSGSDSGSESSDVPSLAMPAESLDDGHAVGSEHWNEGNTSTGGQGQAVGDLECMDTLPDAYHVHAHLSIVLNGELLQLPNGVGHVPSASDECSYQLHTHDASGLIHVHAAEPTDFTLGQFFDVWGRELGPDNVAGLQNMPVVIYITEEDDTTTEYSGEFGDIALTSHRLITIQVGEEISEIPNFTWAFD